MKTEKVLLTETDVDFSIYETLADRKSAFGKIAIDCLYILSERKNNDIYEKLLLSHYYFSVGFQLYDDVKDFKEDFQKQFNQAVYRLSKNISFSDYQYNVEVLNKLLYLNGIGQSILAESVQYFQKAANVLSDLNIESEWVGTISKMRETIEIYLEVTNGYIDTLKKKIEIRLLPKKEKCYFSYSTIGDIVLQKGLKFIESDYKSNSADLNHYMYFSKNRGFENGNTIHFSDTFQRAMLNDCLIDVVKRYNLKTNEFFNTECDYLISRINHDEVGGWSYYPTIKEIAADIDDLGQILQLFIRLNRVDLIEKYCLNPIRIALDERVCSDGGIETWIIPRENQSTQQQKQEWFNTTKWGIGPDLEVVANFIYALYLYDCTKYLSHIENALSYISQKQHAEGYWESRWYYGNWYGTYISLRIMRHFQDKYSINIKSALSYITSNQHADGGFGLEDNISDALSTALALLSLKLFDNDSTAILNAESYLRQTQLPSGAWDEIDFIKPRAQEPYKSKTITTAIVLKSLC